MYHKKTNILITGVAGFIGAAVAKKFIQKNFTVTGIDNLNNYYDKKLKEDRLAEIKRTVKESKNWKFFNISIENNEKLNEIFEIAKPNFVINLAAQAGVRYSLINPEIYIKTNLVGFGNVLENCRRYNIEHLVYASSSSVYGGNKKLPYCESQPVNHPLSLYAATKKSNELLAHTYSNNFNLKATGLRFFTVYGPWGRPDMAPIIFAKAIYKQEIINLNNFGNMSRDFTYIDDIVEGVYKCCLKPATKDNNFNPFQPTQETSFAPHRIFNIGGNSPIELFSFIEIIERFFNKKAILNLCELPDGDVISTAADTQALEKWIGFKPKISIHEGMDLFLKWFKEYY